MDGVGRGENDTGQALRVGPRASLPSRPTQIDAASTAHYIRAVLEGLIPLPEPIGIQADHIVRACKALEAVGDGSCLQALAA